MTEASWTTRDGKKLLIKNMETYHIKNCILMLKRNIKHYEYKMSDDYWDYYLDGWGSGWDMMEIEAQAKQAIAKSELMIKVFENELLKRI